MLKINGTEEDYAGKTISEILALRQYAPTRVAVERNGQIVPKAAYDSTVAQEHDCIEIVNFVGGG